LTIGAAHGVAKQGVRMLIQTTGFVLAGFFSDPVPEKFIPLRNSFSPNFGIFKVQGGCPIEKYSATLGLQPEKSVE